ncbi:hypothetical protein [Sandarakinorhabdus sp. AAP62]|uniref:hypothetical protein n=1 Tax=Sandarakinorhabdus sp. AAP62 TaxID=1248916 RepID=UPI00187CD45C|nr:hypothetical protein [Sandarakinorhabdus sp. AAP62]
MLHYLDVMIGFVFTMLVLSLAVTAMVQAVPVYLGNLKGVSLQNGLIDLVLRISHDPATGKTLDDGARGLIDHILRDPLLSPRRAGLVVLARDVWAWLCKLVDSSHVQKPVARARAAVMHREEFVRLLLDFAGTQSDDQTKDELAPVRQQARDLIGVQTAAEARALLVKVRDRVAALELQEPTWSSSRRSDQAMLEVFLASDPVKPFMSKLVGWYDQTIDRVEAAFTARVRNWTTGISFALVLVLQLDSFDLLARLNADSALRDKVVASAIKAVEAGDPASGDDAAKAKAKAEQCAQDHLLSTRVAAEKEAAAIIAGKTAKEAGLGGYADCMGLSQATKLGLVTWPDSHEKWLSNWQRGWVPWGLQVTGMFLSLGLLSLGAPFWYEMLSNLIKLRSTIARKDEAARVERQTTQAG